MAKVVLPKLTEKAFQAQVVKAARLLGWRVYHTFDSRRSAAGFPDLVMVRGYALVIAEVKTDAGRLTPDQIAWLTALRCALGGIAHVTVAVWRPSDWPSIEATLRG